jgi:hypothetical protein
MYGYGYGYCYCYGRLAGQISSARSLRKKALCASAAGGK